MNYSRSVLPKVPRIARVISDFDDLFKNQKKINENIILEKINQMRNDKCAHFFLNFENENSSPNILKKNPNNFI